MKEKWADRLRQSLATKEEFDYTHNALGWDESYFVDQTNIDMNQAFVVGLNAVAHRVISKTSLNMADMSHITESPLEEVMMLALVIAGHESCECVRYKINNRIDGEINDTLDCLLIEPQAIIGDYRADFLLTYEEHVPDYSVKVKTKSGEEMPGSKRGKSKLIVECDGHDFHDRTKEQASRDRARDRELQKLGYPVFRFTGADIWDDVMKCSREAISSLCRAAWD